MKALRGVEMTIELPAAPPYRVVGLGLESSSNHKIKTVMFARDSSVPRESKP